MQYNKIKSFILNKKTIIHFAFLLILSYFVFHSIYGNRGFIAYFTLKSELQNAHQKLDVLRNERLEIENRTKLLRPDSLDIDMLDEKARNMLGLTSENEQLFQPTIQDK